MNKRLLLQTLSLLLIAPNSKVFGQAAAESALVNALSSTSTIKAGSELNRALNRDMSKLGGRIQPTTTGPVHLGYQQPVHLGYQQKVPGGVKTPAIALQPRGTAPSHATQGIGTISIRGGEVICTPANPGSQASSGKTPATASSNCHSQQPTAKVETENEYKSFVTLPAPK